MQIKEVHVNKFWSKVRKDCTLLSREREVGGATETFGRKDESVNKYILE